MAAPKTGDSAACLERAILAAYRRALEGKVFDVAHDLMQALVELQTRKATDLTQSDLVEASASPGAGVAQGAPIMAPITSQNR